MMKRLLAILVSVVLALSINATDILHIGTYRNELASEEYEISGEYEDGWITTLHISTYSDTTNVKCSISVKGTKNIKKFCHALQYMYEEAYALEQKDFLRKEGASRQFDNVEWPRVLFSLMKIDGDEMSATRGWSNTSSSCVFLEGKMHYMISVKLNRVASNIFAKVKVNDGFGGTEDVLLDLHKFNTYIVVSGFDKFEEFVFLLNWKNICNGGNKGSKWKEYSFY